MDNNPDQPQQPGLSNQPSSDAPVFSSSDLTQTKARKDTQYFTNVQKATLGQKISNWFNKVNRESLERSATRKAAFKAKLAERRRAADLAAISAAVPDLPARSAAPRSAQATTTAPQSAQPAAPAQLAATTPATQQTPSPIPQLTPTANPAMPVAPSTVIIEDTPTLHKKRLPLILAAVLLLLVVAGIIITLLLIRPWENSTPVVYQELGVITEDDQIIDIDLENALSDASLVYISSILQDYGDNVYGDINDATITADDIAANIDAATANANITDEAKLLLFELEKARVYLAHQDIDQAKTILDTIDEADLYTAQASVYYYVMALYCEAIGEPDQAQAYIDKQSQLAAFIGG